MPRDADANQPADPTMEGPPAPIVTSRTTWHLDASPADLEGVAGILSGIGMASDGTRDKVDSAAVTVFAEGAWEGETAEAYLGHRGRLSNALVVFTEVSHSAARALSETAEVLRTGQAKLDDERDRLSAVPVFPLLGIVTFFPRDEAEATTVRTAVNAAIEIREWVDAEISRRRPVFDQAAAAFHTIADAWEPRSVRHLNLNAGMGNRDDSTTREKLDELAAAIAAGDADVVTLQEVLEHNVDDLLARLGDDWQLAAYADPITVNVTWDDDNPGRQGYGNAILVRAGGAVEVPAGTDPHSDADEIELSNPVDSILTQVLTGERPEDRSAAVVELTIREPDAP